MNEMTIGQYSIGYYKQTCDSLFLYLKNNQKKRIDNMRPSESDFFKEVFALAR